MKPILSFFCIVFLTACGHAPAPTPPNSPTPSGFQGRVSFLDPTCPRAHKRRFCKLESVHEFYGPNGKLNWKSDAWVETNSPKIQSGTTNGADIPILARPFVGRPFDTNIIPAAIIHDHYTFLENRVRPWRETHLMYLQILLDQGVNPIKAYTQYFAIHTFGAHWTELVRGENCGLLDLCIKNLKQNQGRFHENNRLHTTAASIATLQVYKRLKQRDGFALKSTPLSPELIHAIALEYQPDNLFLQTQGRKIFMTQQNRTWLAQNTRFVKNRYANNTSQANSATK